MIKILLIGFFILKYILTVKILQISTNVFGMEAKKERLEEGLEGYYIIVFLSFLRGYSSIKYAY
jgi:hypothetical protein